MAIVLKDICFGNLINNLNLEINQEKITCIVGNSGSYKSVLGDILGGKVYNFTGSIFINDNLIRRKKIGYFRQDYMDMFLCEKVSDEIVFSMKNSKYSNEQIEYKKKELCELFEFSEDFLSKRICTLSNSEKKLVLFASIIACNPDLIVLDGILEGFDFFGKKKLINIIKKLKSDYSKTIVIISNDIDTLIRFVDYVVVLDKGQVVMNGNKMDVFTNVEKFNEIGIALPSIIEFSYLVKKNKDKKIGYYDDIKDLMKAVYRNV